MLVVIVLRAQLLSTIDFGIRRELDDDDDDAVVGDSKQETEGKGIGKGKGDGLPRKAM